MNYSTLWGGGVASQVSMTENFPAVVAASTQVLAADTNRKYIAIQNNSLAGKNMRLNFDAAATVQSFRIPAGATWVPNAVPTNAIMLMGELAGAGSDLLANECCIIVGS